MDEAQRMLNKKFETVAWGVFFIWWGITALFSFLPRGVNTIGIGLILLGLNIARYARQIPTSGFTVVLGVIALVLGGFEFIRNVLALPFQLDVFPILLIVLGVVLLARELMRGRS